MQKATHWRGFFELTFTEFWLPDLDSNQGPAD